MLIIYSFVLHWAVRQRKQRRADEQGMKIFEQHSGSRRCMGAPASLCTAAPFCGSTSALCSMCPFLWMASTLLFHWCCKIITLFSCNNVHVYSTVSYEGAAGGHMATPCTLLVRGCCDSRRAITHKLLFLKIYVFCRSSWYFIYVFVPSHLSGGKQTLRVPQAELLNLPWLCFPYIMFIAENQNVLT